jgi:hypothetical protein
VLVVSTDMKMMPRVPLLIVFFLLIAFWYQAIRINWAPSTVHVQSTVDGQDPYLGADIDKDACYFRDFPATIGEFKAAPSISALTKDKVVVEYWKKPLYGPVSAVLSLGASELFGLAFPAALVTGCMAWLYLPTCGATLFVLRQIDQRLCIGSRSLLLRSYVMTVHAQSGRAEKCSLPGPYCPQAPSRPATLMRGVAGLVDCPVRPSGPGARQVFPD